MRRLFFTVIAIAGVVAGYAMESGNEPLTPSATGDTTVMPSLEQIIAQESKTQRENVHMDNLRDAWSKNTYLNLIYNTSHKMSSDEIPSTSGVFSAEYEGKMGLGLEWGHTFNFHKKPIGNVLFFGLDFTWMDLEMNKFDKENAPAGFSQGEQVRNMPWHNEKMTIGYGISVGPSMTLYPFSSVNNSSANNIRLQFYFHVGYGVEGAIIKDAIIEGADSKNGYAIGHGLYTSFGGSLSWKIIGIGYEFRNDGKLDYKVTDKDYDTGNLDMKEKTGRLYLQFRF